MIVFRPLCRPFFPLVSGFAMACACLVAPPAMAQARVVEAGDYTLRVNTLPSDNLPVDVADRLGIEQSADRGILHAVILRRSDGSQVAVAAQVDAIRDNLMGKTEAIAMRPVRANDRVSYMGSFEYGPLRNYRFVVTAVPPGSSDPLVVEFEDSFRVSR